MANHFLPNPKRQPLFIERGEGAYIFDSDGRRYMDLVTGLGVNALGHQHPRITAVIAQHAGLIHTSGLYGHCYAEPLAERLCQMSRLDRALFTNSGTEATELALKLIRCYGTSIRASKTHIVALQNSFHGRTRGALSVAGQPQLREPFQPFAQAVTFVDANDDAGLRAAVSSETAAILFEPILGEGGVVPLTTSFLQLARELTHQHDALLVADECQTGLGRTGRHFSFQHSGIQPDVVTVAKPLAGGLPLGAVMFSDAVNRTFPPSAHATTFGGGPLACRVALEFLDVMEALLPNVREIGGLLENGLREIAAQHSIVTQVRGQGLLLAMQLAVPGDSMVADARDRGLLINCTQSTVLRFLPPFVLTDAQVQTALTILEAVVSSGTSK
ncbi:MAG: acetylornithine transaminase [Acidobacteriota bacterium]